MNTKLHTDRDATGRYRSTPPCDCCGKPIGVDHLTDDEVVDGGDGPGFYLCARKRCESKRDGLTVAERRALYEATRRAMPGVWL